MLPGSSEIWITGVGIISALGSGFEHNIKQLKSGHSPVTLLSGLNSIHDGQFNVGQITLSNKELVDLHQAESDLNADRTSILAKIAFNECLTMGNAFSLVKDISIVCATTVGGMSSTELRFNDILNNDYIPDAGFISEMDCGNVSRILQNCYKTGGENYTLSTACSSSSNAIMLGGRMIRAGMSNLVIAGGSDSLSKFVMNGFISLKNVDSELCKPFDYNRSGLNLGEGAAFLLLENSEHAKKRYVKPLAILTGYCNVNETYHITGSSPEGEGASNAMSGAMKAGKLNPDEIDFIHAHGTSTIDNDLAESVAISHLFNENIDFASSKCYTGHTLAASGAISSVLSIGMMEEGFLFPALNFKHPIPESGLSPVKELREKVNLNNILVNSFGFGGNNTSLLFSKYH